MAIDHEKVEQLQQKLVFHTAVAAHAAVDGQARRIVRINLVGALAAIDELEIETSMDKIAGRNVGLDLGKSENGGAAVNAVRSVSFAGFNENDEMCLACGGPCQHPEIHGGSR